METHETPVIGAAGRKDRALSLLFGHLNSATHSGPLWQCGQFQSPRSSTQSNWWIEQACLGILEYTSSEINAAIRF